MTQTIIRRFTPVVSLVVALLLMSSTGVSAKHRHGAVRKASHSSKHSPKGKRYAKLSHKHGHVATSKPLSLEEKQEMVDKIKELAKSSLVEPSTTVDSNAASQSEIEAELAQAAKEEAEEDDVDVSIEQFFRARPGAIDADLSPDVARERQNDYTLYDESDPDVAAHRSDIMEQIIDWIGTRYEFGGENRGGIDCSAFTRAVFEKAFGLDLPRTAVAQSQLGENVSKERLQFGDLVFFKTARYASITHVGIYIGEGLFANAACSKGVSVASLSSKYWSKHYIGAKRLFANSASAGKLQQAPNSAMVEDFSANDN
jgi:cell wall-associated NlpC family hydrolase